MSGSSRGASRTVPCSSPPSPDRMSGTTPRRLAPARRGRDAARRDRGVRLGIAQAWLDDQGGADPAGGRGLPDGARELERGGARLVEIDHRAFVAARDVNTVIIAARRTPTTTRRCARIPPRTAETCARDCLKGPSCPRPTTSMPRRRDAGSRSRSARASTTLTPFCRRRRRCWPRRSRTSMPPRATRCRASPARSTSPASRRCPCRAGGPRAACRSASRLPGAGSTRQPCCGRLVVRAGDALAQPSS